MARIEPKRIVARGYDRIARAYLEQRRREPKQFARPYLDRVIESLPPDARVLDLGCGAGEPSGRYLAGRVRVVGVDISRAQLALARELVPEASLVLADMGALAFRPGSFGAVVALYSIIHLPREEHELLFSRVYEWLRPGGRLLAVVGQQVWEGREPDWLVDGVEMFWSHYGRRTYPAMARRAGYRVLEAAIEDDPMGGSHLFLIAEKPR